MARRLPLASLVLLALATSGCARVRGGVTHLWEITKESGGSLLWDTLVWTVGAGLAGLVLGIVSYRLLARAGAFRWDGAWGQAARILTGILLPQLLALFLASAGLFEGLYRGSQRALLEGTKTRSTYQLVGAVGSEAVGGLYYFDAEWRTRGSLAAARTSFLESLSEFRAGRREIHAEEARLRLRSLTRETIDQALGAVREESKRRFPSLGSGRLGRLTDALFAWLAPALDQQARDQTAGWSIPFLPSNPLAGLPERLPAVAARSGDPARISYDELATFVVEQVLVEPSLGAIRLFCRSHAAMALAPIPFVYLVPLALFALARWLKRPPPEPTPTPPRSP